MKIDFEPIIEELNFIKEEGVPRNVKDNIDLIIVYLNDSSAEESTKINKALTILDDVANDINLASHSRTSFWNLSSMLESMIN